MIVARRVAAEDRIDGGLCCPVVSMVLAFHFFITGDVVSVAHPFDSLWHHAYEAVESGTNNIFKSRTLLAGKAATTWESLPT